MTPSLLTATAHLATTAPTAPPDDSYLIWGAVLLGIAIVLLVVELFVPSGGLIGILAGIAIIASLIAFFSYDTAWGIGILLLDIVLIPLFIVFMFKYWMSSPFGQRLVLGGDEARADDPEAAAAISEAHRAERANEVESLIGATAVTETALRPVGTIRIGSQRIDAMAEHGVIEPGVEVIVVDAYDNQLKVRPAD